MSYAVISLYKLLLRFDMLGYFSIVASQSISFYLLLT
jgi:hypothetical protein